MAKAAIRLLWIAIKTQLTFGSVDCVVFSLFFLSANRVWSLCACLRPFDCVAHYFFFHLVSRANADNQTPNHHYVFFLCRFGVNCLHLARSPSPLVSPSDIISIVSIQLKLISVLFCWKTRKKCFPAESLEIGITPFICLFVLFLFPSSNQSMHSFNFDVKWYGVWMRRPV